MITYLAISALIGSVLEAAMWVDLEECPKWWQAVGGAVLFGLLWPFFVIAWLIS